MPITIKGILKKIERKTIKLRFNRLKNKDFTIICNNCWAGHIYQQASLSYMTPTIGLFFYMPCYINFLENFDDCIEDKLHFISKSKYDIANTKRATNWYPIGKIKDIEIHFLHYKTIEDASEKWYKRIVRINKNNLFIVGSERDLCNELIIRRFQKLPFKNKIFFTANYYCEPKKNLIQIKSYKKIGYIGDIYAHNELIYRYFDVIKWLNKI